MVLVTKPMFCDMGNQLRPFSEAPDQPEGQELAGGAVVSQEGLQQVKFVLGSNSASEHARDMADMLLVEKLMFLGIGNHLGPFSGALAQSECQEQGEGSVGGPGWLHGVNL